MDPFSDRNSNKKFQDHKNLTCILCTRYYNNPRVLPCHDIFCYSCIKTLCDKSPTLSPTSIKKKKITCPKCKAHINVPSDGAEGFPVDEKTQALKDKVIQELAQNISRSINNPREETSSRFASNSPIGNTKFDHQTARSQQSSDDNENLTSSNKGTQGPSMGGHSSIYGDFSKYAKYFNQDGCVDGDYRPTIRADHTRLGYESSTRFKNRRLGSSERKGSEEKELRRRTWYGSTLQSRRTQSLNRASMFVGSDNKERKSPENLFNISEDKEQMNATDSSTTFGEKPLNRTSLNQNRSNYGSGYKSTEERSDYYKTQSSNRDDSNCENPCQVNDSAFEKTTKKNFTTKPCSGGSTRTTLPTHRENVITNSFMKNSKDKNYPVEPGTSFKTNKNFQKMEDFQDKKTTSSVNPNRISMTNFKNSEDHFESDKNLETDRQEPRTFVGSRHHRLRRSKDANEQIWRDNEFTTKSFQESGRAQSIASREKLHLNIDSQGNQSLEQESHFRPKDHSPRSSKSRKNHKGRSKSIESRYSLNKNDFKTESEFREHLLNMTMSKEKYQLMMEDFKKGQLSNMRSDSIGGYDFELEDSPAEILVEKAECKENIDVENILTEEVNPPELPREPLLDESLITSFRAKYSSPLDVKHFPKRDVYPEYCDGITKCWSYQKNDYGIPTSAAFSSSGNLIVAEYGLSCLELFDASGHLEHNVTGIKPYGLTLSSLNQNIIVGDRKGKCIRIFDEFGADVSQIDNLGSVEWLAGMTTRKDGGLILCDRGRCKILICNSSGEKIKEFGSFGSSAKQLCMADFLIVDSKNRILVADSGNHCIKVFDPDGNYLKAVGSRGSGDGQMEWPKGIAVDKEDNIIVADTLNHRISLYSPDGIFVKHLMTSIPDPYNITWSDGLLGVLHYNLKGMSQYDVYAC